MKAKIAIVVRGRDVQDRFTEYNQYFGDETRDYTDDDQIFADALVAAGCEVSAVAWHDKSVDWASYEMIVLRSPWGFFFKPDEWENWLKHLERVGARLENKPALVRKNQSKAYLLELEKSGVSVAPTEIVKRGDSPQLAERVSQRGWREFVVKPASLGGALDVGRAKVEDVDSLNAQAVEILSRDDLVIQEFFPEIAEGEWSFVFFGDNYSHAVRKIPKEGEWREQAQYGGQSLTFKPSEDLISQADFARLSFAKGALYSRIDALERDGKLYLNELELIDPRLFFANNENAAEKLVREIFSRLSKV